MIENTEKLLTVLSEIKQVFVGKDEIIDLLGVSLVAGENTFLFGPPGTAKSAIVKALADRIVKGRNFEYLLTRFTEPNELFGPFDIKKLREGELVTNIDGMMPQASMVFLDELFNANSAILNSLLMALNERKLRRGKEILELPALMFVGASNALPEDEALEALFDRFLIRVRCGYVAPELLDQVLIAGRNLERSSSEERATITPNEIKGLQKAAKYVDLKPIIPKYIQVIQDLRNAGISISDRRAVKLQGIIAASAALCKRDEAQVSDLWVLAYIWESEEQIEILRGIIDRVLESHREEKAHPQSKINDRPDAEVLMKEIQEMDQKWSDSGTTYEDKNIVKDKLRFIQSRSEWIANKEQKEHVKSAIENLWKSILEER